VPFFQHPYRAATLQESFGQTVRTALDDNMFHYSISQPGFQEVRSGEIGMKQIKTEGKSV
jgi:hypothetical protein